MLEFLTKEVKQNKEVMDINFKDSEIENYKFEFSFYYCSLGK